MINFKISARNSTTSTHQNCPLRYNIAAVWKTAAHSTCRRMDRILAGLTSDPAGRAGTNLS